MSENARNIPNRREILTAASFAAAASVVAGLPRPTAFAQGSGGSGDLLKIGIVGSGNIGSTLGALWIKAGHPVLFSSRHPEELKGLVDRLGPLARAGTVAEAVSFGEAILLAVPYRAYPELAQQIGPTLAGKLLLDAGNAVAARDGDIAAEARENGIGLTTAKYFPGARIVRAFNTLGYRVLEKEANRPGTRMAIPIAGDDADGLATASKLVRDAGFDAFVVGPLARAKDFAQGAPMYGQQLTAEEMRGRFGVGQ